MTRTSIGLLLGLGLAALVASRLEGSLAAGVLGGYLLGGAVALLSSAWLRHSLRMDVGRAMRATMEGFLMKLAVALLAAVTLRYIEPAGRVLEWRGFLLAYTVAAMVAVFLSAFETSRALKESLL
jgi:hypothetical protein